MTAILFGSIGVIAETSELQRSALNQAFQEHGLNWHWPREQYRSLLAHSGGQQRIAAYGAGSNVDARAIHASKSRIFQNMLLQVGVEPRRGVLDTIHGAQSCGMQLGLVSATSPENVAELLTALHPQIQVQDFAVIVDSSKIKNPKPLPDAYFYALMQLGLPAEDCIAIEDNEAGVASARNAGIRCVAFPGQNTAEHDYSSALGVVDHLEFDELLALMELARVE